MNDQALFIQAHYVLPIQQIFGATPSALKRQDQVEDFWDLSTHLYWKKVCDPKHKIPTSRKVLSSFDIWGLFLSKKWNLCSACHGLGVKTPYANGAIWFKEIIAEAKEVCLYVPISEVEIQEQIKKIQEKASILKQLKNPCEVEFNQKHSYGLIQTALNLCAKYPQSPWEKKYLRPYIGAYDFWAYTLKTDKEVQAIFENGGKLPRWKRKKKKVDDEF